MGLYYSQPAVVVVKICNNQLNVPDYIALHILEYLNDCCRNQTLYNPLRLSLRNYRSIAPTWKSTTWRCASHTACVVAPISNTQSCRTTTKYTQTTAHSKAKEHSIEYDTGIYIGNRRHDSTLTTFHQLPNDGNEAALRISGEWSQASTQTSQDIWNDDPHCLDKVDFYHKSLNIASPYFDENNNGKIESLKGYDQLDDILKQRRIQAKLNAYIFSASSNYFPRIVLGFLDGCFLVYDPFVDKSIESMKEMYSSLVKALEAVKEEEMHNEEKQTKTKTSVPYLKDIIFFVVATKADRINEINNEKVASNYNDVEQWRISNGIKHHYLTSSKENFNIDQIFQSMTLEVLKHRSFNNLVVDDQKASTNVSTSSSSSIPNSSPYFDENDSGVIESLKGYDQLDDILKQRIRAKIHVFVKNASSHYYVFPRVLVGFLDGCFLVYDPLVDKSIESMKRMYSSLVKALKDNEAAQEEERLNEPQTKTKSSVPYLKDVIFIVVADRINEINYEKVTSNYNDVEQWRVSKGIKHHYLTSSKANFNINQIFQSMTLEVLKNRSFNNLEIDHQTATKSNVSISSSPSSSSVMSSLISNYWYN
ncbi:hypothetical protein PPL_06164 [Heterostelium album PN500]|uniref:Uncharacterized protein n=1 Tax=Heterostelium pallidum (strain ATCC 26659 / Pp 5 / PN500) TaxID=670386 RepID=D3BCD9_HETP5|nr:hypothetical protein PPL_06164 [Heterostelium album PN500]EFA80929.1 hypothetical protein PPL_06164 [Heterostelium album PN500]|eukprot:XP_020433047.1 hypothetical protein PPL_06164 [Heterostelium album PN500]